MSEFDHERLEVYVAAIPMVRRSAESGSGSGSGTK